MGRAALSGGASPGDSSYKYPNFLFGEVVMQTKLYRQQHGEMRRLLDEASKNALPLDPESCRSTLARLAGILKIHLAMEDKALYPRMLTHDDAQVRQTAGEYQQSMGQLAPAFESFYERWRLHGAIEQAPQEFSGALRVIQRALRERMDLEDANLYDLVDDRVNLAS